MEDLEDPFSHPRRFQRAPKFPLAFTKDIFSFDSKVIVLHSRTFFKLFDESLTLSLRNAVRIEVCMALNGLHRSIHTTSILFESSKQRRLLLLGHPDGRWFVKYNPSQREASQNAVKNVPIKISTF